MLDSAPRFRKRCEIPVLGNEPTHLPKESAKDYKFSGRDGKPA